MPLTTLTFGVLLALSSIGAGSDIVRRKLPNLLSLVMAIAGLTLAFMVGGWEDLGWHAAHALVAFAIGYLMFILGIFGAGDGKFYAASATFFPLTQAPSLALAIVLSGGILAIFWIILKRMIKSMKRRKDDFAKLPYGVAIAVGAVGLASLGAL